MKKLFTVLGIGIFLGLVGVGIFGERGLVELWKLRAERKELEKKAQALERENQNLLRQIELLKNDYQYLERLARGKLGMIRPDEIILKLPDESESPAGNNQEEK